MFSSARNVALVVTSVALVVGYFFVGDYMYRMAIGLDPSAFPLGESIQRVAVSLSPGMTVAAAAAVWVGVGLLAVAAFGFVAVRRLVRGRVVEADPGRRSFSHLGQSGHVRLALIIGHRANRHEPLDHLEAHVLCYGGDHLVGGVPPGLLLRAVDV